LINKYK